jgi:ElaB/YqjD/DUF883 family membrane-anchored ribosome-binding protein
MGDTAAELKTLVSPTHIKQEIRNYVQQERESLSQAIQRKIRDNPLQAAAVGAAVAYPALGLLRSVPVPLWLIGAGLFLTSDRGRQTASASKSKIDETVQGGSASLSQATETVKSQINEGIEQAQISINDATTKVAAAAGSLADQARAGLHEARDALGNATSKIAENAGDLSRNVTEMGSQRAGTSNLSIATPQPRTAVENLVHEYPLVVAGLGAAVGIFLAASIPASDAENRLFGAGSRKLKDRARQAANEGIEKAGELASEAIAATAVAAARAGISSEGVRNAIDKVAEGIESVMHRGLNTALPDTSSPINQAQIARNQT